MKSTFALLLCLVASALTGCVTSYEQSGAFQNQKLDRAGSVFVTVPEDGHYKKINYPRSGLMTGNVVNTAFLPYFKRLQLAETNISEDEAFARAGAGNFTYLIEPTILHWEDRATEWSDLPDRITISLKIFDVKSRDPIAGVLIKGRSSWWTFGGDKPEDLLPKPISDYAASLFN